MKGHLPGGLWGRDVIASLHLQCIKSAALSPCRLRSVSIKEMRHLLSVHSEHHSGAPTIYLLHQVGAEQHHGDALQTSVVPKKKTLNEEELDSF